MFCSNFDLITGYPGSPLSEKCPSTAYAIKRTVLYDTLHTPKATTWRTHDFHQMSLPANYPSELNINASKDLTSHVPLVVTLGQILHSVLTVL